MQNNNTGLTFEQMKALPAEAQKDLFKRLSKARKDGKQGNFSCTYGAFPPKISEASGMPLATAQIVFDAYWKRNKAIKQISEAATIRTIDGQMWVYQPVSRFWYSLRVKKDVFSTLNQGTGAYCFDMWLANIRAKRIGVIFQYHDELVFVTREDMRNNVAHQVEEAMVEANRMLKLNVWLTVSVAFGPNYAAIH